MNDWSHESESIGVIHSNDSLNWRGVSLFSCLQACSHANICHDEAFESKQYIPIGLTPFRKYLTLQITLCRLHCFNARWQKVRLLNNVFVTESLIQEICSITQINPEMKQEAFWIIHSNHFFIILCIKYITF